MDIAVENPPGTVSVKIRQWRMQQKWFNDIRTSFFALQGQPINKAALWSVESTNLPLEIEPAMLILAS